MAALRKLVDEYENYNPAQLASICNLKNQLGDAAYIETDRLELDESFWKSFPEPSPWPLMKMMLDAGFCSGYLYSRLSWEDIPRLNDEQWDDFCDTFCEEDAAMDAMQQHLRQVYSERPYPDGYNTNIMQWVFPLRAAHVPNRRENQ